MNTDPAKPAQPPEAPPKTPPKAPESRAAPPVPKTPAVVAPALAVALLVLAAVAGLGAATRDSWLPLLRGPQVQVPDLSPRIAALEARIKALEERPLAAPAATPPPASAVDKEQLDALARRLAESESRAADLARRLAAVETARPQSARADATAQAVVLAVGPLRDAAAAGRPFGRELEALRALAEKDSEIAGLIARLAPTAEKGAPTTAALRERFDAVARAVAVAARGGDNADWTQRLKARVFALVAVRRTDGAAPAGTPDAALLAAEKALAANDVARAVAALEGLSGPAAAVARDWLAAARARVALDAALAELHARAVAALAGGG